MRTRNLLKVTLLALVFLSVFLSIVDEAGAQSTVTYFPFLADGGSFSSEFYFVGVRSGLATVTLNFYNRDGTPLNLKTNRGTLSTLQLFVNDNNETSLISSGLQTDSLVSGWAKVSSDQPVGAMEIIKL